MSINPQFIKSFLKTQKNSNIPEMLTVRLNIMTYLEQALPAFPILTPVKINFYKDTSRKMNTK